MNEVDLGNQRYLGRKQHIPYKRTGKNTHATWEPQSLLHHIVAKGGALGEEWIPVKEKNKRPNMLLHMETTLVQRGAPKHRAEGIDQSDVSNGSMRASVRGRRLRELKRLAGTR